MGKAKGLNKGWGMDEVYIYRGISFRLTSKGFWIFGRLPEYPPYNWNMYFKEGDKGGLDGMKKAIDRSFDNRSFDKELCL